MSTPIVLQKHEPERRRKAVTTLHCGCTCCCCCCLHTIGSIVGAAVAPAIGSGEPLPLTYYYDDEIGADVPLIRKPSFSSVTMFWWLTCVLIFGCFAFGIISERGSSESVLITAVIVLLIFPGLQLISAVLTLFVYLIWPRYDKFQQIAKVGKILGGVVLGALAGTLVMAAIGFGFSLLAR
ncbi:MAG TPA: hypothetical protein VFE62_20735 [Gemmataceae bacterium]|nr:hypothetical protein [Gemmataceae bacterium]